MKESHYSREEERSKIENLKDKHDIKPEMKFKYQTVTI